MTDQIYAPEIAAHSSRSASLLPALAISALAGFFLYGLIADHAAPPILVAREVVQWRPPTADASRSLLLLAAALPAAVGLFSWLFLARSVWLWLRLLAIAAVPGGLYYATGGALPDTLPNAFLLPDLRGFYTLEAFGPKLAVAVLAFMFTGLAAAAFSWRGGSLGAGIVLTFMALIAFGPLVVGLIPMQPGEFASSDPMNRRLGFMQAAVAMTFFGLALAAFVGLFLWSVRGVGLSLMLLGLLSFAAILILVYPWLAVPHLMSQSPGIVAAIDSGLPPNGSGGDALTAALGDPRILAPLWASIGLVGVVGAIFALMFSGARAMTGLLRLPVMLLAVLSAAAFVALSQIKTFALFLDNQFDRMNVVPEGLAIWEQVKAREPAEALYVLAALLSVTTLAALMRRG